LFLGGDVMTGRGIDQALPCPAVPLLHEPYIRDAREYVKSAELRHGPIPRPLGWQYIWGDGLAALGRADLRIINLETAVTTSDDYWPGKEIHYRMNPANIGCLTSARIDCCCLANNHVLDWGYGGLLETLRTLEVAGLPYCGAGRDAAAAAGPAILAGPGNARVRVYSFGAPSSGIPHSWAAGEDRPGVNFLEDLAEETAQRAGRQIGLSQRPEDLVVASIHWGRQLGL
jgi:poly-gamma-glutamate synthesis protein (capsule biosynthesis protein)